MKVRYRKGKLYLNDRPITKEKAWEKLRAEFIRKRFKERVNA